MKFFCSSVCFVAGRSSLFQIESRQGMHLKQAPFSLCGQSIGEEDTADTTRPLADRSMLDILNNMEWRIVICLPPSMWA